MALFAMTYAASAQSPVIDGLYDCQRATNGRTYCKRAGSNNYVPVSEEFFSSYEMTRRGGSPQPQPATTVVNQNQTINNVVIQLKTEILDVKAQMNLMDSVLSEQKKKASASGDTVAKDTVVAIEERIAELGALLQQKEKAMSGYSTSVRPDDAELNVTARKASEIYPKVPYYIPGTKETGEFWIEPVISDTGALVFRFKFVDVSSSAEKVRSSIEMKADELEKVQKALAKVSANSTIAHEKKIRRKMDVRVECFPNGDCPPEGQKIDSKASTEIIFSINEDGSTSGRIQRNKGRFEEGYNISIKSALLLQAYIAHVLTEGRAEFEAGTASEEDLKNLFK